MTSKFSRRDFLRISTIAAASSALTTTPFMTALAQDPVTIRLIAWGNPTEYAAREAPLALFHETHPGIRVEFIHTPEDYMTKVQTMVAGGDYPDVMFLGNGEIPSFVQRQQLLALDSLIERDNFDTSDIFPANLALYNVDGTQYGFPVDAPNKQIFYNADMFEAAGVEPPSSDWADESWDWEAFLEKARALTDKENNQWGWQVKTDFRSWWVWVTANGGEFFNEDGTECVLNQPAAVEAFQFMADLIHVHEVAPPMDVASEMGGATLFESGITAMETWWPAIGYMRENIGDKFVWDIAPHPAGAAGKTCTGGGTGHAISAFSQHPDEAWEFLKFVASPECVEPWTDIMGIVPPLQSVAESEVFLKPGEPPMHINVFTEGAAYLRPDPRHPKFTQAAQIAGSELDRLSIGEVDAQEACDNIVEQVNRLL